MTDSTIVHVFKTIVRKSPDARAVSCLDCELTYAELDRRSNQIANWLRPRLDVEHKNKDTVFVPVCFKPGAERIAVILAILKLGAAYAPIDPRLPALHIQHILSDLDARLAIADADNAGILGEAAIPIEPPPAVLDIDRETACIAAQSATARAASVKPASVCYVMYTSGATGRPRGVMVRHRSVVRLVVGADYFCADGRDTFAQLSNFAFDAATFEIWGALLNGARLEVIPGETVLELPALRRAPAGSKRPVRRDRQTASAAPAPRGKQAALSPGTTAAILHAIWTDLLHTQSIGIHDDFFQIGGDSLLCVQMICAAHKRGIELSLQDLTDCRSIAGIVRRLESRKGAQRSPGSPLVKLHDGDLAPLFLVHPAGGSSFCYRELAARLGSRRPVFAFEANDDIFGQSIPEIAAGYVAALQAVDCDGPFVLGGWSFGGIVAQEMARQLELAGRPTPLVILIDSPAPGDPVARAYLRRLATDGAFLLASAARDIAQLSGNPIPISYTDIAARAANRETWFVEQLRKSGVLPPVLVEGLVRPFIRRYRACVTSLLTHRPEQCHTNLLVIRALSRSEQPQGDGQAPLCEDWSGATDAAVMLRSVPGTHESVVFEPFVKGLAAEIRSQLERLSPAAERPASARPASRIEV